MPAYTVRNYYEINGVVITDDTQSYDTGGLTAESRSADTSGEFTPGVYKTTPFVASTANTVGGNAWCRVWYNNAYGIVKYTDYSGELWAYNYASAFPSPHNDTFFSDLEGQAVTKALSKLTFNETDLLVELGEAGETIAYLKEQALRSAKLLRLATSKGRAELAGTLSRVLRQERKHAADPKSKLPLSRKAVDSMSSEWMGIRYGLRPIVYSLAQMLELLRDGFNNWDSEKIRTKSAVVSGSKYFLGPSLNTSQIYNRLLTIHPKVHDLKCSSRASVHYTISEPPTLPELLGVSMSDIPTVLHELTTLSFVLNWIMNTSELIASHTTNAKFDILGNTVTSRYEIEDDVPITWASSVIPRYAKWVSLQPPRFHVKRISRNVNVEIPVLPTLRPTFKFDSLKAVDLLAIGLNLIPNKGKGRY